MREYCVAQAAGIIRTVPITNKYIAPMATELNYTHKFHTIKPKAIFRRSKYLGKWQFPSNKHRNVSLYFVFNAVDIEIFARCKRSFKKIKL